jgi:hypothetical protein
MSPTAPAPRILPVWSVLVPAREGLSMLQWKPRLYAVLTLAALAVAAFGGYAGDAGDTLRQFGW